jgi:hypothetical protein
MNKESKITSPYRFNVQSDASLITSFMKHIDEIESKNKSSINQNVKRGRSLVGGGSGFDRMEVGLEPIQIQTIVGVIYLLKMLSINNQNFDNLQ